MKAPLEGRSWAGYQKTITAPTHTTHLLGPCLHELLDLVGRVLGRLMAPPVEEHVGGAALDLLLVHRAHVAVVKAVPSARPGQDTAVGPQSKTVSAARVMLSYTF